MATARHLCEDLRSRRPEAGVVDPMSPCNEQLTRHLCAQLLWSHITRASYPLSEARIPERSLRDGTPRRNGGTKLR